MYLIVLAVIAAVVAGVLIANAVFSHPPRRRRRMPPGGEGEPPAGAPVPAYPIGPRGSPGDEELPPFELSAERWDPEPPPHLPYPGERSSSRRADDGPDSANADSQDGSGGGDDD